MMCVHILFHTMESTSAEYLLVDPDSDQLGGGTEVDDDEPDVPPCLPASEQSVRRDPVLHQSRAPGAWDVIVFPPSSRQLETTIRNFCSVFSAVLGCVINQESDQDSCD